MKYFISLFLSLFLLASCAHKSSCCNKNNDSKTACAMACDKKCCENNTCKECKQCQNGTCKECKECKDTKECKGGECKTGDLKKADCPSGQCNSTAAPKK